MHKVMTQAQIDANRRNAQKSTGPRTPAGKTRASRNNTRHGFFTRALVLSAGPSAEDPAEFERLRAAFRDDFQPASHYERVLVDVLATCMWRARRVKRFEARLFGDAPATPAPAPVWPMFSCIERGAVISGDLPAPSLNHPSHSPALFEGNILYSLIRYENRLTRQFERAWNLLRLCKKKHSLLSIQKRLEARAKELATPKFKSAGNSKNGNSKPSFSAT